MIVARAKVTLVGSERFLGPGVVDLLEAVAATGSVKAACERIGLSYSKGRRMLRVLEAEVGYPCVARRPGGQGGGHAALTPACATLLARFRAFTAEVDADVLALFARHFRDLTGTPSDAAGA